MPINLYLQTLNQFSMKHDYSQDKVEFTQRLNTLIWAIIIYSLGYILLVNPKELLASLIGMVFFNTLVSVIVFLVYYAYSLKWKKLEKKKAKELSIETSFMILLFFYGLLIISDVLLAVL